MAACQQWADTPPPFVFWVSTVQPPLICCLFSCLQDPFSITGERKRKEERREEKLTQKLRVNFLVLVGQYSFLLYRKWPRVMPDMASVTLDVIWVFACPRMVKKHRPFSVSVYSSKEPTMVLDEASKETFLSFYQNHSFCDIHLPESQCSGLKMHTVIVITTSFSFSNLFYFPSSFHSCSTQDVKRLKWKFPSFVSFGTKNLTRCFPSTGVVA